MSEILTRLADVLESRKLENGGNPETSYIARLFSKGDDAILKKIGEEATETVMAAKDARATHLAAEAQKKLVGEVSDLWFHCLVMLSHYDLRPEDVLAELARREGLSGLEEKALRKRLVREQQEG